MDIASMNTAEDLDLYRDELVRLTGLEYLDCNPYQWKGNDGKVYEMTNMSLRQLKDSRKLIVADRESLAADNGRQEDISRAIAGENGDVEAIVKRLMRLMSDKENELREEIHKRP